MANLPNPAARWSRRLKNIALFCLLTGFALELGGGVTSDRGLFKTGLFLFLVGLPLLFVGIWIGRRRS